MLKPQPIRRAPGHVREVHGHHQDVRDALVAFMLEVVLGEPERVVAEPVHALRDRLGLREHRHEVLVRIAALVRGSRILAHVTEVDVTRVKRRELADHRGSSGLAHGGGHRRGPFLRTETYHERAEPANSGSGPARSLRTTAPVARNHPLPGPDARGSHGTNPFPYATPVTGNRPVPRPTSVRRLTARCSTRTSRTWRSTPRSSRSRC